MKEYVLKTENLTKVYKNFTALNDLSLGLEKGKIYGLIGKNGAGKTTFMRIIAGLSYPTSGTIELFGKTSLKEYNQELCRVGSLIEYPSLNGKMTAKENLKVHRIMRGIPNDELDEELLVLVGLGEVGTKKVKNFSLGMRQRLGIAIALISNPELLILDEPVNGLDPVGVVEIRNLIKSLCEERNITVLISSHNLPELYQTATDYIIIDQGNVKQCLTLAELEERCDHFIKIECDEPERLSQIIESNLADAEYKVMPDKSLRLFGYNDEKKMVSKMIYEHGIIPTHFSNEGETLENYFLSVIGGSQND
ncbi:ABC transporter ATP-binding protein [Anaeromicropila herbilytica]|uniref:Bacitracin ABC transporter ATP-binding protein n=1 Tax=Anaeromicropila herbilytica TaxID=2785025 RepID=A0A7R7EHN8_9FIRM|nr:ATP-binding cassette domain-containing protein [Anaeromicropila herbilytica]BCN28910.1 bacitracin ABC transporter ATP-binding protein [Anaeromicropila herbilytica]